MSRPARVGVFLTTLTLIYLTWPPAWPTWIGYAMFLWASWPGKSMDPEVDR